MVDDNVFLNFLGHASSDPTRQICVLTAGIFRSKANPVVNEKRIELLCLPAVRRGATRSEFGQTSRV